jgi:hypothetical protein
MKYIAQRRLSTMPKVTLAETRGAVARSVAAMSSALIDYIPNS